MASATIYLRYMDSHRVPETGQWQFINHLLVEELLEGRVCSWDVSCCGINMRRCNTVH